MLRTIVFSTTVWTVLFLLAGCAEQEGNSLGGPNKTKADEAARATKEKTPEINATTFFAAGVLLENQGNMTGAIEKYNKAIDMDPSYESAYNRLGGIHLKLQQFDQAEAVYQKALKRSPNNPAQLNNLAFVHLTQHRYADAEKELRKALKVSPKFQRAHANLGIALAKQGKYSEALDHFRAACTEAQANYNLATILHAEGKADQAKKYYLTALKFDPEFKQAKEGLKNLESPLRPATQPAPTGTQAN
jgi:superkiller protein 3